HAGRSAAWRHRARRPGPGAARPRRAADRGARGLRAVGRLPPGRTGLLAGRTPGTRGLRRGYPTGPLTKDGSRNGKGPAASTAGPSCTAPAGCLLLGDGLLGNHLAGRALAGLLRHRRGAGAGGGLRHLATGIAVAGVVALALGRLAVALAHRVAPGFCSVSVGNAAGGRL